VQRGEDSIGEIGAAEANAAWFLLIASVSHSEQNYFMQPQAFPPFCPRPNTTQGGRQKWLLLA
jgi:hypothetical protein